MSFSVEAKEFIPAASAADRRPYPSAASDLSGGPKKERVCMAYYESADCPFGRQCEHAHHFTELSPATQMKLLSSVPAESIPSHFVMVEAGRKTLTPYGRFTHESADANGPSARRRPPMSTPLSGGTGASRMSFVKAHDSHPFLDAASMSSRTSSTTLSCVGATPHSRSPQCSHSKAVTPSPTALDHTFKMYLPNRCRYPHQDINGTYYDILGVPQTSTHEEILDKFRNWRQEGYKRMKQCEPSMVDAMDLLVVEARNILGNPVIRAEYDLTIPKAPEPEAATIPSFMYDALRQSRSDSSDSHASSTGFPFSTAAAHPLTDIW